MYRHNACVTLLSVCPFESCANIEGLVPPRCPLEAGTSVWYNTFPPDQNQWYKKFPPDHFGRVEMKKPTGLSNKTSTA